MNKDISKSTVKDIKVSAEKLFSEDKEETKVENKVKKKSSKKK